MWFYGYQTYRILLPIGSEGEGKTFVFIISIQYKEGTLVVKKSIVYVFECSYHTFFDQPCKRKKSLISTDK